MLAWTYQLQCIDLHGYILNSARTCRLAALSGRRWSKETYNYDPDEGTCWANKRELLRDPQRCCIYSLPSLTLHTSFEVPYTAELTDASWSPDSAMLCIITGNEEGLTRGSSKHRSVPGLPRCPCVLVYDGQTGNLLRAVPTGLQHAFSKLLLWHPHGSCWLIDYSYTKRGYDWDTQVTECKMLSFA